MLNSVLWDILVCMAVGDTYHILLSIKISLIITFLII